MVEISIPEDNGTVDAEEKVSTARSEQGWDGKMRVNRAVLANPEALSDPDYSDPDAPPPEEIAADEDLLNDEPIDSTEINLVHCRISSIPALRLERFSKVQRLCLRQNAIQWVELPENIGETLEELDLYDNLLSSVRGFDNLDKLTMLDLSFNKIKHIKHVSRLTSLKELYFVSNKISRIENLEGLTNLTMIELAANRIREIENLNHLTGLQELWLARNKITELKGIDMLSNLRLLDLKSNRLTSITGLENLCNLEEFYVSHNLLESISPESFANNPKLRVIDISNNKIPHLENVSHLKMLEEFWAGSNLISDFKEVERELKGLDKLETVYFEANPLQFQGPAVYRNKIRLALPQIKQIDATFVRV